jgi:hypothetical protein
MIQKFFAVAASTRALSVPAELAPKCCRIPKWLEHFLRRARWAFALRFVQRGIFVDLAHWKRACSDPVELAPKTNRAEALPKLISACMKGADKHHEMKTPMRSKSASAQPK